MGLNKIIKHISTAGIVFGTVYLCIKKSQNTRTQNYKKYLLYQKTTNDIEYSTLLNEIDDISDSICLQIKLDLPRTPLHKSISSRFLNHLKGSNDKENETLNVLRKLSHHTKNQKFLTTFLDSKGLEILQKLLEIHNFSNDIIDDLAIVLCEILANLSQNKQSLNIFQIKNVQQILNQWDQSSDVILNLNHRKINYNINQWANNITNTNHQRHIFQSDIFLLDDTMHGDVGSPDDKLFDVVFINGMLGSVYFTWRQHDEVNHKDIPNSKCWPRDWLSPTLPQARIVGVNALLRPFIWNPMSDIDKLNRPVESRAQELSVQLLAAGVGSRPVIWVTHSAGGILLKYLLYQSVEQEHNHLAASTKSIMFMSTPHSGAQSLLGLYYFPFKYFLTPEAMTLETNSQALLELNIWFKMFCKTFNINILTLTETEPTIINKFYSTVIVPKDDGEFEAGHNEVKIKANHLYISKPRDQSDAIYQATLNFIRRTMIPSASPIPTE